MFGRLLLRRISCVRFHKVRCQGRWSFSSATIFEVICLRNWNRNCVYIDIEAIAQSEVGLNSETSKRVYLPWYYSRRKKSTGSNYQWINGFVFSVVGKSVFIYPSITHVCCHVRGFWNAESTLNSFHSFIHSVFRGLSCAVRKAQPFKSVFSVLLGGTQ